VADKKGQFGTPNERDNAEQSSDIDEPMVEVAARTERLREAVEAAGGPKRVSRRSGVPLASLNNYRGGRDMKAAVLVALADACRVSVEWLATGRGRMEASYVNTPAWPHEQLGDVTAEGTVAIGPTMALDSETPQSASRPSSDPPRFGSLNIDLVAASLEAAEMFLRARGYEHSWHRIAQAAALLYDSEPAEKREKVKS
jgi:hypothetical protein